MSASEMTSLAIFNKSAYCIKRKYPSLLTKLIDLIMIPKQGNILTLDIHFHDNFLCDIIKYAKGNHNKYQLFLAFVEGA